MIDGRRTYPTEDEIQRGILPFVDVTETGMTDIEFADGALDAGVQLIPAPHHGGKDS